MSRNAGRRLAIIRHAQEVTGNVALTCRYYGVTRPSYYKWLRRYEELGVDGLRDRSRRPRVSPTATKAAVVDRIIYLRQNYHFGPLKIAMYRILRRLDLSRLPTSQRYKRHKERWKHYEKQRPGVSVEIDVKFIDPIRGVRKKHYQFTAIDDCTRLRVLKIYGQLNQKTAIQFADYVLEKLPFRVEQIQTDNGAEFQSAFHWHLLDRGLRHVYIRPLTPRLNGKVERSHRIDDEEFYRMLAGEVIDDAKIFNIKLQEWEHFYNFERPHGALAGQTPYERLRQATQASV
ncbi:MAG: IS481 family transposase [Chloroflexi bacterium]|nr:MAG: IS481 family transposase [Chloroflexota bacterium]